MHSGAWSRIKKGLMVMRMCACMRVPMQPWSRRWAQHKQQPVRGAASLQMCHGRLQATPAQWRCSVVGSVQRAPAGFTRSTRSSRRRCMQHLSDGNLAMPAHHTSKFIARSKGGHGTARNHDLLLLSAAIQEGLRAVRGTHDALNSFAAGVVAGSLVVGHYQGI